MYSFLPCTIREWNSLPEDIATLQNLDSFKKSSISMTVSLCVFIFVCRFIYLFTFKDPSQESSFLKEVGFHGLRRGRRRRIGLSLRAGSRGFPPAAMSMTPSCFNRSQRGNKTIRTFSHVAVQLPIY